MEGQGQEQFWTLENPPPSNVTLSNFNFTEWLSVNLRKALDYAIIYCSIKNSDIAKFLG